jgi:hypothetical protein
VTQASAPIISSASVEVFFTSALRWLNELLGAILQFGWRGRGARLKRLLSHAERNVECLLFLKAVALHPPPPRKRITPRAAPRGFRRITGRGRLFFRSARIRAKKADALQRLLALIDALIDPARAVRHFQRKLGNGLSFTHIVATAPPSETLAVGAIQCVNAPDTS